MSLITASIVRTLRTWEGDLDDKARKLLAFVDNRQDASLQAGHFNDFVQVTQLRGALYRALDKAPEGLTDEIVAQRGHGGTRPDHGGLRAEPRCEVQPAGRGVAGAARGDRVPALPGPGARLAGHHAEPGADRAAPHQVPRPPGGGRRRRGLGGLPRRAARRRSGAPGGDRRRAARRAAAQPGHRRRIPQRRRLRPGPAPIRAASEGAVVAAGAGAPADGRRGLPRPGQTRPATQQHLRVRPRPVRPVPDPRVRQPEDQPQDARRAGDHHRPVQRCSAKPGC